MKNVDTAQVASFYQALSLAAAASSGGGGSAPTLSFTWNGETRTLELTPEMISGVQTGIGASIFGRQDELGRDLSFSKSEIATGLHMREDRIEGLVSKGADQGQAQANGPFALTDVIPWLSSQKNLGNEQRV